MQGNEGRVTIHRGPVWVRSPLSLCHHFPLELVNRSLTCASSLSRARSRSPPRPTTPRRSRRRSTARPCSPRGCARSASVGSAATTSRGCTASRSSARRAPSGCGTTSMSRCVAPAVALSPSRPTRSQGSRLIRRTACTAVSCRARPVQPVLENVVVVGPARAFDGRLAARAGRHGGDVASCACACAAVCDGDGDRAREGRLGREGTDGELVRVRVTGEVDVYSSLSAASRAGLTLSVRSAQGELVRTRCWHCKRRREKEEARARASSSDGLPPTLARALPRHARLPAAPAPTALPAAAALPSTAAPTAGPVVLLHVVLLAPPPRAAAEPELLVAPGARDPGARTTRALALVRLALLRGGAGRRERVLERDVKVVAAERSVALATCERGENETASVRGARRDAMHEREGGSEDARFLRLSSLSPTAFLSRSRSRRRSCCTFLPNFLASRSLRASSLAFMPACSSRRPWRILAMWASVLTISAK